jgi:hypothetical protein
MSRSEPCRRDAADGAVRPHLVLVAAPARDLLPGLVQRLEPLLVQALVSELAVEALDVGVLRGLAGVVDQVLDAAAVGPGHEGAAGELRPLVGTDGPWVASELSHRVEHPCHVLAAHAVVDGDVHALAAEVIDHRQALDAPAAGQRVHHEVGVEERIICKYERMIG